MKFLEIEFFKNQFFIFLNGGWPPLAGIGPKNQFGFPGLETDAKKKLEKIR
jgi:hypothetical protein